VSPEERGLLWHARHNAYYAALALRPGSRGFITDVCVPISALASCIVETKHDMAALPAPATIVGHVGDGNFHVIVPLSLENEAELAAVERFSARLVERALACGGTCTGEHGVGLGKKRYLVREHGEALGVMQTIKEALDPLDLLNPGKIVDRRPAW
jgi:D-lactate dehydrogenase (cytochrome)